MSDIKKMEMDLGDGRVLSFETGRLAREAGGSVIIRLGDTMVLATATMAAAPRAGIDFFPLLVDFEEKLYAVGRIPGGFFKREGRPTEKAILTARLIDRPMRPMFPEGFRNDVQIVISPLSVDYVNAPDILAMIGASAALSISEIPFQGPVGSVKICKINGEFVAYPTQEQTEKADLEIIISGTADKILMIESGSKQASEEDMIQAIELGQKKIRENIEFQKKFAQLAGQKKIEPVIYSPSKEIEKLVKDKYLKEIEKALQIEDSDKQKEQISQLKEKAKEEIKKSSNAELVAAFASSPSDLGEVFYKSQKNIVRDMIVNKGRRPDGRKLDEIRPLSAEIGYVPRAHGSGIFSRGHTQVLTIATLGAVGDEQRIEGLTEEEQTKRYMHHYNFPAYSVGEVRPLRGPGRREIGHGALAEKALMPVIPDAEKFPYTIRLVSEVLGSNGSTSMASTCGSTLALMDAGVPIEAPVGGISIGLVAEGNKEVVLTDIQGVEDFFGDMDFKVAGTHKGITAIQLDVKNQGISMNVVREVFEKAKAAREKVLAVIEKVIGKPREELSKYAPRITAFMIDPSKIGMVIGPGGKTIKGIIEETGVQIDINDDGRVFITGMDPEAAKRAESAVKAIAIDPKVGDIYEGRVVRLMNFGAFVEIAPGKDGLVHISQLSQQRVNRVEDVVKIGDIVKVKVVEIDDMGRVNLTMKNI